MKKIYIQPSLFVHKIDFEGNILASSPYDPEPEQPEKGYHQEGPYTKDDEIDIYDGDADEISGR